MDASTSLPPPESTLTSTLATPAEIINATTQALHQLDLTTTEENQQTSILAAQIDLCNSAAILHYGESLQRQLANLVDSSMWSLQALDSNTHDNNDFLSHIYYQIQRFSKDITKTTLNHSKKSKLLKDHYHLITQEIDRAEQELLRQRLGLQVHIRNLEQMYEQVLQYYQQLKFYLAAGQQQLSYVRETQLPKLKTEVESEQGNTLTYGMLENQCNTFEKRLQDLKVSQALCLQTAVQVQLAKTANQQLVLNIQNTILTAFSLWKQSIATALTLKLKASQQAIADSNATLSATLYSVRDTQRAQCTKAAITALADSAMQTS